MPIEIRELHIRAVVDAGGSKGGENANASAGAPASSPTAGNEETIIGLCVEKIMEILKDQKER